MMNKNRTGLIIGILFAVIHAVWALCVAIASESLQQFMDWIFVLHSIEPVLRITAFSFMNSILLVIVTFIFGYILGWIFALIWNNIIKKK
ncbi:hypothetical protein HYW76_03890 [Candidatus Pacearchaeota archaeon]|nr:hypothetical protein [Candidatus Pacearchaeota archaeon]